MKKFFSALLASAMLLSLAACGSGGNSSAGGSDGSGGSSTPQEKTSITFADVGWDSIKLNNALAGLVAEEVFGYTWQETPGSTPISHEALMAGDVDVHMEEWTDNISAYQTDLEAGKFVELGINFNDNYQGFYVPRYVIDQYPDLEMVAQQSANWDQTEAYEKTEAILEANPEITGIICGNDTMACGAAAACADAGRTDIKIIGVDGSDDAAALIKSGQMVGTALQQCALIAEMAVEQADYYINNNGATLDGVGEKQLVPCVAITAENVDNLSAFVYTEG